MAFHVRTALMGAALIVAPGLALAQEQGATAPTADSAAAQVGQSPKAALDENGKRIEPSKKLWNNPRTEAEQPGTQPPANTDSAKVKHHSGHHGHAHHSQKSSTAQDGQQSVTSPLSGAKSD